MYDLTVAIHIPLFTNSLEDETRGLKIDSENLSPLHFADDILICNNTLYELHQMLQEFADKSGNQCLNKNM